MINQKNHPRSYHSYECRKMTTILCSLFIWTEILCIVINMEISGRIPSVVLVGSLFTCWWTLYNVINWGRQIADLKIMLSWLSWHWNWNERWCWTTFKLSMLKNAKRNWQGKIDKFDLLGREHYWMLWFYLNIYFLLVCPDSQ